MQFSTRLSPGRAIEYRKDMTVACLCIQDMEKALHGSSSQAWMKRGKIISIEMVFISISLDKIRPETIKVLLKKVLVLLQIFRALAQGAADAGVKIALQKRKKLVPYPVAQKTGILIGGIQAE